MFEFLKNLWHEVKKVHENDPVHKCELYKEQGCAFVDDFLCDVTTCEMNEKYKNQKEEGSIE